MSADVVIVGGGIMGASVAFHLTRAGFDGTVTVVESDPTFAKASTTATNSCLRLQFSTEINVRVSQYGASVVRDFPAACGDERVPRIAFHDFGYLFLAATEDGAEALRAASAVQRACGAQTRLMTPAEIAEAYPFYALDGIRLGNHGPGQEGYFDGATMWDWWRRLAREAGVRFVDGEVVALEHASGRITAARLADGTPMPCGWLVNAAGTRAARLAAMAGIDLAVEPRKRFTYVFEAETPLPAPLPLTVDPSGVHMRSDGALYMAGCGPVADGPVDAEDFDDQPDLWMEKVWPALAARVPAFEAIRLRRSWVGHYAWNRCDQNAVAGPHPQIGNFLFCNGFSGHGLQQAPAMGRGLTEWICTGAWQSLDLSPFAWDRVARNAPLLERAVI